MSRLKTHRCDAMPKHGMIGIDTENGQPYLWMGGDHIRMSTDINFCPYCGECLVNKKDKERGLQ